MTRILNANSPCPLGIVCFVFALFPCAGLCGAAGPVDLSQAVVVVRGGELPNAEKSAAEVLVEEVAARTGLRWERTDAWQRGKTIIAITSQPQAWGRNMPARAGSNLPEARPDGYRVFVERPSDAPPVVWIQAADARGTLFGVGELLRNLDWAKGKAALPGDFDVAVAPAYPIRGHQIGYRARANSWDAWTADQFDQYFRELALFGTNAIENIPFQDDSRNPLMKFSREKMNEKMSEICDRYGLEYWVWVPADLDLKDDKLRAEMLESHETLYRDCKRLDGVFFPGGDPGDNPPELVLPFLEDVAARLEKAHPQAKIWLSLQQFSQKEIDDTFKYIDEKQPPWLGGLVSGPSDPPVESTRSRLRAPYKFRLYPDITHNKLAQYEVPWWDPAFATTLGREAINPRPREYAEIHNAFAPYSDGFISYSDGVHDDVNKVVWSMLSFKPNEDVRKILVEYCRFFFDPAVAEDAADGILALEKNWLGALADNGAVEGTLLLWNGLEKRAPQLAGNWRWQMNLLRANYDASIRRRLLSETTLEDRANAVLARAPEVGSQAAMQQALDVLNETTTNPVSPQLRARIEELCQDLFNSIALQTSVDRYQASGAERGAILDFVDYPLNNRWWLEDRFAQIAKMPNEQERLDQLELIRTWEHPGEGSFYDDIGNIAKSPRAPRSDPLTTIQAANIYLGGPTHWWLDNGKSRARLSWLTTEGAEASVVYTGLDPEADYVIRVAGYGQSLLRGDKTRLTPTIDNRGFGEFKEFPVPREIVADRKLLVTWDRPTDEDDLNWRQQSRTAEIWLLKQPAK